VQRLIRTVAAGLNRVKVFGFGAVMVEEFQRASHGAGAVTPYISNQQVYNNHMFKGG
jgi:hypothetical protein